MWKPSRALVYDGAPALREAVTSGGIEVTMAYGDAESDRPAESIHAFWQQHVGELLAEARPDLDAPIVARLLLSSMGGDLVLQLIRTGQAQRYRRAEG